MLTHWVQITTTDLVQPQQWSDLRSKQQPGSSELISGNKSNCSIYVNFINNFIFKFHEDLNCEVIFQAQYQ